MPKQTTVILHILGPEFLSRGDNDLQELLTILRERGYSAEIPKSYHGSLPTELFNVLGKEKLS